MACVPPTSVSAGFLFLDYSHTTQNLNHRSHVRLNITANPLDPITMFTEANTWAGLLSEVVSPKVTITGWGTQNIDGVVLLQQSFGAAIVGIHGLASGAEDYKARTVTITGRGIPTGVLSCKGPCVSRMFVADAFNFQPGQRFYLRGQDTPLDNLADYFAGNSVTWFDYYGQKGTVRGTYPTQFHAYIQHHFGQ